MNPETIDKIFKQHIGGTKRRQGNYQSFCNKLDMNTLFGGNDLNNNGNSAEKSI